MGLLHRAYNTYRSEGFSTLVSRSLEYLSQRGESEPVVKRIGHATSTDLTTWVKDPTNPVFLPSKSPEWDSHVVEDPSVLVVDGTIHMIYAGTNREHYKRNHIGHATSVDMETWDRDPANPVFTPDSSGKWDSKTVQNPDIESVGDRYHMVYDGSHGDAGWIGIGHATSDDLTSWERRGDGPILPTGSGEAWDSMYVADPCLLYDEGTAHLFYTGFDGDHWQIGHAKSEDLSTWEKNQSNPIIGYQHTDDWDYVHVGNPTIMRVDETYHMIHIGNTGTEKRLEQAMSDDLVNWESLSEPALTPEPAGTWEDTRITNPSLFEFQDQYHLLYVGVDGSY